MSLAGICQQLFNPLPCLAVPDLVSLGTQLLGDFDVACHMANRQQGSGGVELVTGQQGDVVEAPYRVAQLQVFVPKGIPEISCQVADVSAVVIAVEQLNVQVALGAHLASAVASEGYEGDVFGGGLLVDCRPLLNGCVEQAFQVAVYSGCVGLAEVFAPTVGIFQKEVSGGSKRCRLRLISLCQI